ncbi:hypothetical protein SAMN05446037_101169 [Anaerovirgula multivorans]|uniref:Uncharacterized protein n=1 Tax=Anaerovirgula multivorans TaxID=312168 RepID=A0A239EX53_9FIRM|nr:hypothetical protein [Anaerovirgula multivorans]SNS49021.1 hypothetical protein SAMN05446037_101169 [Anaerovirgula multivorans]
MRIETLKEEEKKYILESVNKASLWDKEFIIYQWYESNFNDSNFESKFKIIFDIKNVAMKAVRVEKKRIIHRASEKKVYYLEFDEIKLCTLLNKPFVAKRRSIKDNLFLDRFLKSNNKCKYMLEVENQDSVKSIESLEFKILKCVTEDDSYLNRNMTILFSTNDLIELELLIKCFMR